MESIPTENFNNPFTNFDLTYPIQEKLKTWTWNSTNTNIHPRNCIQNKDQILDFKRKKTRERRRWKRQEISHSNKQQTSNMTQEQKTAYYTNILNSQIIWKQNWINAQKSQFNVVFDWDYHINMRTSEINSLALQFSYWYSINKYNKNKICFNFTNYKGEITEATDKMGANYWHCNFYEEEFPNVEDLLKLKKKFVYLTPDSDTDLDEVSEDCIYVIGGWVDKPVIKNKSLNRARGVAWDYPKMNVITARLPLRKYVDNIFKCVLNVNTVVEIISFYWDYHDWSKAIELAIPKRMID